MTRFCDTIKLRNELSQCKSGYKILLKDNESCQAQNKILGDNLGGANRKIHLLTEGPEPPAIGSLRVISINILHQLFADRLGDRYMELSNAGKMFWSDANCLVSQKPDLDRYCAYLRDHWLPIVKPYTVIEWERLDGEVVKIASCDCDNFAGWYKYKPAEHGLWAALAITLMWAVITGPLMKGYHGFDVQPTWAPPYNEQSIEGLELWNLEPQVLGTWPVEVPGIGRARVGQVRDIIPKPIEGYFTIESIGLGVT